VRSLSECCKLPDHNPVSDSQSKGRLRQEGEAAAWSLGLGLSAFVGSCELVRHPSCIYPLFAVLKAPSANTACVYLGSPTSAVPPPILQLVVLKSRSLLEPGEVVLSSAYKLLILPQYCEVIWDMTAMERSGYFVHGSSSFDLALSHCYFQLTMVCEYVVFLAADPMEVNTQR